MWTEKGVVVAGVSNGLLESDITFVIPKAEPNLIIGPYEKGDDVSLTLAQILTLSPTPTWNMHVPVSQLRVRRKLQHLYCGKVMICPRFQDRAHGAACMAPRDSLYMLHHRNTG